MLAFGFCIIVTVVMIIVAFIQTEKAKTLQLKLTEMTDRLSEARLKITELSKRTPNERYSSEEPECVTYVTYRAYAELKEKVDDLYKDYVRLEADFDHFVDKQTK